MIAPAQLRQIKDAFNSLAGRLEIQKKMAECALERLEEEERKRDELEAACAALALAIRWAEEGGKQEPAAGNRTTDSRNSSRNMAVELPENVAETDEGSKLPRRRRKKEGGEA